MFLHGVNAHPNKLQCIRQVIANEIRNVDFYVTAMPLEIFSFDNLDILAWELLTHIDQACEDRKHYADGQSYTRIILVGHSLGVYSALYGWLDEHLLKKLRKGVELRRAGVLQ